MKFIDLFAGIGGFHLALTRLNMECVFASEIDKFAREVYIKNYNIPLDLFNSDIRTITPELLPEHDILCAGFPCQPFSQAGHKRGFDDVHKSERGNLFYYIADILKAKKPNAFILENVRHLLNHDNGKTFQIISDILHKELNYTIYYKIIKASDFGSPQHRPRLFIVGFNNDTVNTLPEFEFPAPIPLNKNMSDIFEGSCSREIGFTLRVGGRGSPIEDRRNWDGYLVNGEEVRLTPKYGKRMMGFPDEFILSNSTTQAMKQLGNSVCVDVVYHVAKSVKDYLEKNISKQEKEGKEEVNLNIGEWSEFYAFLKMIETQKIHLGDTNSLKSNNYITVFSLQHNDMNHDYWIYNDQVVIVKNEEEIERLNIHEVLPKNRLDKILSNIVNSKNTTFSLDDIDILNKFEVSKFKGSSNDKQDLFIGFKSSENQYNRQPFGIKSFLGGNPTLLNASSNTNFIYKITGFDKNIDMVNSISTRSKIRDRINYILDNDGKFEFFRCEKPIFQENLSIIDGDMTEIISVILLEYFSTGISDLSSLVKGKSNIIKMKRFLEVILLGMFPGKPWDGKYTANGLIVVKKEGDLLAYHIIERNTLMDYLFNNTKLDTPSSSRHGFGKLYYENGELFFKLNLQIRNK
ncbi:HpaII family restriction endonuclease [Proteus penneri]|uniref:HpaII family restriction endonuclease n=1 Tax=Proteus TaxID=583 RepID=UPI000D6E8CAB|nr:MULTISPECIES: HpaII family restriction endonuclease [Proteus]NBM69967.1 HpaII family restriction endonuclease [Proteus sp. G2663]NBM95869.1 HpaII family restriction endonuclease [Proteus sp. G2660]QPT35220.1 HpaII family restriction endonuclease [Proteus penneri]